MKKRTILLFTVILCFISAKVLAQETTSASESGWKNNLFVNLGGGGVLKHAEQDKEFSLSKRITFGGQLSLGTWFNPKFGTRLQFQLGALEGCNYLASQGGWYVGKDNAHLTYPIGFPDKLDYTKSKDGEAGFCQKFNYNSLSADFLVNVTNLFRDGNEFHRFDFIPFIGIGYMHATESPTNQAGTFLSEKIGGQFAFSFNPKWKVYLEIQANFTDKKFDGYVGDNNFDMVNSTMIGVQYNIGK